MHEALKKSISVELVSFVGEKTDSLPKTRPLPRLQVTPSQLTKHRSLRTTQGSLLRLRGSPNEKVARLGQPRPRLPNQARRK